MLGSEPGDTHNLATMYRCLHGTGHSKTRDCKCWVNPGDTHNLATMYRCLHGTGHSKTRDCNCWVHPGDTHNLATMYRCLHGTGHTAKPEMANVGSILVTLTILQQCTVACMGQDTAKPDIANVGSILVTLTILQQCTVVRCLVQYNAKQGTTLEEIGDSKEQD